MKAIQQFLQEKIFLKDQQEISIDQKLNILLKSQVAELAEKK